MATSNRTTWTGAAGNGLWDDPSNWDNGTPNGTLDVVVGFAGMNPASIIITVPATSSGAVNSLVNYGTIFSTIDLVANVSLINYGVLDAGGLPVPVVLLDPPTITNTGTFRAQHGATLRVDVAEPGDFTNLTDDPVYGGGVLTGGLYDVIDPQASDPPGSTSLIDIVGLGALSITTLNANVVLAGSSSDLRSGGESILKSLYDIGLNGALTLYYGFNTNAPATGVFGHMLMVEGALNLNSAAVSAAGIVVAATGVVQGSGMLSASANDSTYDLQNDGIVYVEPGYANPDDALVVIARSVIGVGDFRLQGHSTLQFTDTQLDPVTDKSFSAVDSGLVVRFGGDVYGNNQQRQTLVVGGTEEVDPNGNITFGAAIDHFGLGDTVDLGRSTFGGGVLANGWNFSNGLLTLTQDGVTVGGLKFSGLSNGTKFLLADDGNGGTNVTLDSGANDAPTPYDITDNPGIVPGFGGFSTNIGGVTDPNGDPVRFSAVSLDGGATRMAVPAGHTFSDGLSYGASVTGFFGTLTMFADGSYGVFLTVDSNDLLAAIEATAGKQVTDTFYYEVTDDKGGNAFAKLTVNYNDINFENITVAGTSDLSTLVGQAVSLTGVSVFNGADVSRTDSAKLSEFWTVKVVASDADHAGGPAHGTFSVNLGTAGGGGILSSVAGGIQIYGTLAQIQADLATLSYTGTSIGKDFIDVDAIHGTAESNQIVGTVIVTAPATLPPPSIVLDQDTGVSSSDLLTNVGKVDVGNLANSATWQYQVNGGAWTDGVGGSFVVAGGDGSKAVNVRQALNGATSTSATLAFILDTTPPPAPLAALLNDTGASGTDKVTNDGHIVISGLDPNVTLWYAVGNLAYQPVPATGLLISGDGQKDVRVAQRDAAGNLSQPVLVSFVLDTSAPVAPTPTLAVDSGNSASDGYTNNGTVNVVGIEANATWQYRVNNGLWTNGAGSSFSLIGDGAKTVGVRQIDLAGNASTVSSLSFTLDTTVAAPTATLTHDTGSSTTDGVTNDGAINVSGLETGSTWQYQVNNGAWTTGAGTSFTLTGDGSKSVNVRQTDKAGNLSTNGSLTFTLDTAAAAPALALATDSGASGTDKVTNVGTVNVSGLETGSAWQYQVNNGAWTTGAGTSFTLTGDGSKAVNVRQTDKAGNLSTNGSLAFALDTTAPLAPTISGPTGTTANGTPTFTGTGEAGDTLALKLDGSAFASVTVGSGGTWSYTPTTPIASGGHSVTATQTDLAGNISPVSATDSFTVPGSTNHAPVFTTGFGAASASYVAPWPDFLSGAREVTAVKATDPDAGDTIAYSLSSASRSLFSINAKTGVLSFKSTPLLGGTYSATVIATDNHGASTSQSISVKVANPFAMSGTARQDTFAFGAGVGLAYVSDFAVTGPAHDLLELDHEFLGLRSATATVAQQASALLNHSFQLGADTILFGNNGVLDLHNVSRTALATNIVSDLRLI